jgi:hypothetical protein
MRGRKLSADNPLRKTFGRGGAFQPGNSAGDRESVACGSGKIADAL